MNDILDDRVSVIVIGVVGFPAVSTAEPAMVRSTFAPAPTRANGVHLPSREGSVERIIVMAALPRHIESMPGS